MPNIRCVITVAPRRTVTDPPPAKPSFQPAVHLFDDGALFEALFFLAIQFVYSFYGLFAPPPQPAC